MRSLARNTALVSLLTAGVIYFLPWFAWSSASRVEYSAAFKGRLAGLPPELLPRNEYEVRVTVSPAGQALGWSGLEVPEGQVSEYPDPMAGFGELVPLYHFGPRGTHATRIAFAVSGLLLVPAFVCVLRRHRWLAPAFAAGALVAVAVALLVQPNLPKYLGSAEEVRAVDLPGEFRVQYVLRYGVTPWFWVGVASHLAAITSTVWGAFERRKPFGPRREAEPLSWPTDSTENENP